MLCQGFIGARPETPDEEPEKVMGLDGTEGACGLNISLGVL